MTIGERIKYFREKKGLTQKQLAELCGVATGTIQQYELNKRQPRLEKLEFIASNLNISFAELTKDADKGFVNSADLHDIPEIVALEITKIKERSWKEAGFSIEHPPVTDEDLEKISEASIKLDLLDTFESLNLEGKQKAASQVKLVAKIPEYQSKEHDVYRSFSEKVIQAIENE